MKYCTKDWNGNINYFINEFDLISALDSLSHQIPRQSDQMVTLDQNSKNPAILFFNNNLKDSILNLFSKSQILISPNISSNDQQYIFAVVLSSALKHGGSDWLNQ